jgi:hypothetical protein
MLPFGVLAQRRPSAAFVWKEPSFRGPLAVPKRLA